VTELLKEMVDSTVVLTLNRPAKGNSLTSDLIDELGAALIEAREDSRVRCVVITGAGDRFFCTGSDLTGQPQIPATDDQFDVPPPHLSRGLELWKPTIAAINGMALGGGLELALACDLRFAAANASVGLPEPRLGTMPGAGGTQRLIRQIPQAWAMELLLTGERWDAERALRAGILNDVVDGASLRDRVLEVAGRIGANAPLAVQAIKQATARGQHLSLADGLTVERTLFNVLRDTQDRAEGRRAFAEKRDPVFEGR
jgi:E-phenylitaconyl-CoA hydratase